MYTEIYVICALHKLEMRKEIAQEWRIVRKIRFFTRKICALHKLEMRKEAAQEWRINMRNRFDRQLVQLNDELIEMGGMIEKAIADTVKALVNQDTELANAVIDYDEEIDHQEREIEQLCLKLLLQQQPVARDLRLVGKLNSNL